MTDRSSFLDPENDRSELDLPPAEENNNIPLNNADNSNETPFLVLAKEPFVTMWTLIFLIRSMLAHVYDVVTDFYLTIYYFSTQQTVYGYLTLAFMITPAFISTWISFRMIKADALQTAQTAEENERSTSMKRVEKLEKNFIIVILFQLLLPLRYLRVFLYAWKVRKYQQNGNEDGINEYYPKLLKEQEDLALVNIMECFVESAPQLILQLTILLMEDRALSSMWFKIGGGCVALCTLGWSMRTYHCAIRSAQPDKRVITNFGSALIVLWHFGTIAARIFLIGIAAGHWLTYSLFARTFIWFGWTIWLYIEDGIFEFCRDKSVSPMVPRTFVNKIRAVPFAVLAVVYMFTFVNLSEGPTRYRNTTYHVLCGLENAIVIALWVLYANQTIDPVGFLEVPILILSVILFMVGIAAMVTYYFLSDPKMKIRPCLSVAKYRSTSIQRQQV